MRNFQIINVWESPTIMSWLNKGASMLRMFILLPLVLIYFNEIEVASWLLFSSIIFFSDIINEQASLIVSRMIAAAHGGAKDLEIISSDRKPEVIGQSNWDLIKHLYGSLGPLNILLAAIGLAAASLMGIFAFIPLLNEYENSQTIWNALIVFLLGQFICHSFRRYASMIRGCSRVALNSRWEALFSILSTFLGALILLLGGDILFLATVMQIVLLLRVFCQYKLMSCYIVPAGIILKAWKYDQKISLLVFNPLWKSIIRSFTMSGAAKLAIVLLSRNLDPASLAKFLLSLRLIDLVDQFSSVPLTSHVPKFANLLAANKISKLRKDFISAFRTSMLLEVLGILFILYFGARILSLFGPNAEIIMMQQFAILSAFYLFWSYVKRSCVLTLIGNNIIAVKRLILSLILSSFVLFAVVPVSPFWGYIAGAYMPMILMLNIYPIAEGCKLIDISSASFLNKTFGLALFIFIFCASVYFYF